MPERPLIFSMMPLIAPVIFSTTRLIAPNTASTMPLNTSTRLSFALCIAANTSLPKFTTDVVASVRTAFVLSHHCETVADADAHASATLPVILSAMPDR